MLCRFASTESRDRQAQRPQFFFSPRMSKRTQAFDTLESASLATSEAQHAISAAMAQTIAGETVATHAGRKMAGNALDHVRRAMETLEVASKQLERVTYGQ